MCLTNQVLRPVSHSDSLFSGRVRRAMLFLHPICGLPVLVRGVIEV